MFCQKSYVVRSVRVCKIIFKTVSSLFDINTVELDPVLQYHIPRIALLAELCASKGRRFDSHRDQPCFSLCLV